jgi:uncharacterized protein (DUF488 family)
MDEVTKARAETIWTVGHSTRDEDVFIDLLRANGIELLVDVRRYPGSRRLPQFGREALEASLAAAGIGYLWVPDLGGRRRPRRDSPNTGWRNESFRGYADHLDSPEFRRALDQLVQDAAERRTVIMCAEALWWQCHRRLIADVLVSRGHDVRHIRDAAHVEPHRLEPPARMVDGRLSYAAAESGDPRQGRLDLET